MATTFRSVAITAPATCTAWWPASSLDDWKATFAAPDSLAPLAVAPSRPCTTFSKWRPSNDPQHHHPARVDCAPGGHLRGGAVLLGGARMSTLRELIRSVAEEYPDADPRKLAHLVA